MEPHRTSPIRRFGRLSRLLGPRLVLALLTWGAIPAALRADVHGGIEIGAKGVKATVVDVSEGPEGLDARVLMGDTRNTTLVAGLASSGRFSPDALEETGAAVSRFAAQMEKKYKVPPERIYVVGSSGLFSALAG